MLKTLLFTTALTLGTLLSGALAQADGHHGAHKAEDAFARREREVMPFDLEATLHVFTKSAGGGVQRVRVREAGDTANLALIRSHLKEEQARFSRGDFADPAYLHGADMAGLATLRTAAAAGRLEVEYQPVPAGAELIYKAAETEVVAALHRWFETQVADHGTNATVVE